VYLKDKMTREEAHDFYMKNELRAVVRPRIATMFHRLVLIVFLLLATFAPAAFAGPAGAGVAGGERPEAGATRGVDHGPNAEELAVLDAVRAIRPEIVVRRAEAAGATSVFVRVNGLDVRAGVQEGKLTNIRIMHPRAPGVPKFVPHNDFFNIRPRTVAFDANGDLYTVEASQVPDGQKTHWYQGKEWIRTRIRTRGSEPNTVTEREWVPGHSVPVDPDYGPFKRTPIARATLVPTGPAQIALAAHPISANELSPVASRRRPPCATGARRATSSRCSTRS
jgi:hypothetical protein